MSSLTRCGRNSRAMRMASFQRSASLYILTASSGFLARMWSASALVNSDRSTKTLACATSTSGTEAGSDVSATRSALAQSCWCVYMSMASFGLSALINSFSACSKRPSSSRYMAYLRCTSGSFSLREASASEKACSNAPISMAYSMASSMRPNLVSSLAPASPPSDVAHAYATFLEALTPPCSFATRMASSHRSLARYMLTAEPQSEAST
mmetsp:Transcript_28675/g.62788  ORF Transcript_28675/g.62788 Transcript_28675/m.62788 type:complete len:210 (+) Transcript_28675:1806-2435(+)